jgi:DNA topoisomerase I
LAARIASKASTNPRRTARWGGLQYVSDAMPGIRRRRTGKAFTYIDSSGRPIRDARTLLRIRRLAIPPAWTDVWISPESNGHLQATGRDARVRKQYRYHDQFRKEREAVKYEHLVAFARMLPRIRRRTARDLSLPELPRKKVLATVVNLLEKTLIRVGNPEYARENGSFGLTTLRNRHVMIAGSELRFHFTGKSGKERRLAISDRRIARVVRACQSLPGQQLFQYRDHTGARVGITSADINGYLREITGRDVTAKDFRTWGGTMMAAAALRALPAFGTRTEAKKNLNEVVKRVARKLGNTPAICRCCYIHPHIIECYGQGRLAGDLIRAPSRERVARTLSRAEAAVLALLKASTPPEGRSHDESGSSGVDSSSHRVKTRWEFVPGMARQWAATGNIVQPAAFAAPDQIPATVP